MATIEMSTDLARMITSILSIGLGGTGSNTALTAFNNLAAGLGTATGDFNDTTYFITTNNSGATNDYYRRSYSILKGNIKTYLTPNIITSIAYSGDGNAVTALSLSAAGVLTVTKGATYNNYSLPLATSSTRGGVKIGYTASGRNYPVQLSNEQMYVNVPWTDHYAWTDITGKPNRAGSATDGGSATTADKVIHTASGTSYIAGAGGTNAAVYAKKSTGSIWYPAVALQTSGGGAWQIGNYNDETLEFQYATAANISGGTNTTSEIYMQNGDTGRVMTSDNYSNWVPSKTGSGASGTWAINITGNAAKDGSGNVITSTYLKLSGGTLTGRLFITPDSDVGLNSGSGSLVIGSTSGLSVGIDANEIMCRNANAASTLYLQNEGGAIVMGANTTINAALTVSGNINNYKLYVGGAINADDVRTTNGIWTCNAAITNAPTTNHGTLFGIASVGTPFQFFMPDASYYVYKRYYSSSAWTSWTKIYAGYADNAGALNGEAASAFVHKTGDTMSGNLYSTALWANQGSGERQVGLTYNGGNLYFWGNPSSGTAGIYDTNGGYVIQRETTYNGYNGYFSRTEIRNHLLCSTKTAGNTYNESGSAIQIREVGLVGSAQSAWTYAPKIGFHWSGRCAMQLGIDSNQWLCLYNNNSTTPGSMRLHNILLEGATDATMTASSGNPRITFQEGTGSQPVHLVYTDYDSYRNPAGLKVVGGTSATPAWFEVEGSLYISSSNTTGNGLYLADDGSIVDNNDGYATHRFSYGLAITDGKNTNTHRIRLRNTGCIEIQAAEGNWGEGLRIYPTGSWSTIVLGGNDLGMGSRGTSASSWSLHNNNGNFYLTKNGSNSGNRLECVNNQWRFWTDSIIDFLTTGGGAQSIRAYCLGLGPDYGQFDFSYRLCVNGASRMRDHLWIMQAGAGVEAWNSAIELRESGEVGNTQSDYTYSPRLGFHWGNRCAGTIGLESDNVMRVRNQGGGSYKTFQAGAVWGAVWNDYVEYREADSIEPGYCYKETESGIMTKTTERLEPGVKLSSDTFGFAIGKTKKAQTPISVSGRVLAYPYKDRNEYHLGDAVCSAPNGTIDVMTREEIMMYPERIIGTVSEIPKYDIWFANGDNECGDIPIEVNGRIWIYVR